MHGATCEAGKGISSSAMSLPVQKGAIEKLKVQENISSTAAVSQTTSKAGKGISSSATSLPVQKGVVEKLKAQENISSTTAVSQTTSKAGKGISSSAKSLPVQKGVVEKLKAQENISSTAAVSRTTSKEVTTTSSKQKECGSSSSLSDLLPVQKEISPKDSGEGKSNHSVPKSSPIQEPPRSTVGGKLKDETNGFLQHNKVSANVKKDKNQTSGSVLPASLPVQEKSIKKFQNQINAISAPKEDLPAQSQVNTTVNLGNDTNCSSSKPNSSLPVQENVVADNSRGEKKTNFSSSKVATTLSVQSDEESTGTGNLEKATTNDDSPPSKSSPLLHVPQEKTFKNFEKGENCCSSTKVSPSLQEMGGDEGSPEMVLEEEKTSISVVKTTTFPPEKKKTTVSTATLVKEKGGDSSETERNIPSPSSTDNTSAPPMEHVKPIPKSSFGDGKVEFPISVAYYKVNSDIDGDRKQNRLKLKKGDLALVMKAEDANFWLIKVGDDIGWAPQKNLTKVDYNTNGGAVTDGTTPHCSSVSDGNMKWEYKKEGFMSVADVNSIVDIEFTTNRTFDHEGSKVTVFFLQVSATRKGAEPNQGEIWVVSKTLKAFNRLRVAWEEEFGSHCIPSEPPHVRWGDCSEADWDTFRCTCVKQFLNQIIIRSELKCSQELYHFLTTYTVDLSGGIVTNALMKPYLDIWLRTSSDPSWTVNIAPVPPFVRNKAATLRKVSLPTGMATDGSLIKQTIPGLKPGDESFGQLKSQRPRVLRSDTFAQISALAAVTKQEALLDCGRKTWLEDSIKVKLLTQGGKRSIIRRRSDRNVYNHYYNDGGEAKALEDKGSFNQMKFETRFNLEKIMYGRMDNLARDSTTKYAAYASDLKKKEEKQFEEGGVGGSNNKAENVSKVMSRRSSFQNRGGHVKKNTQFVLDALVSRLDKIHRAYDIQTSECLNAEGGFEMCQYMSKVSGRFTMPLPAQLMALEEMTTPDLERWITVKWPVMGAANTYHRLKEIETFLERRRVYVRQLLELVDQGRTTEEVLLITILCCSRLVDAVEAEEGGLWVKLPTILDVLNLRRCRLIVSVMAAEARSEEASRGSRKSVREVHADVQRSRKALNFVTKAVTKIRSGVIQRDKFDQLRERLDAAADAAHEEYRDAIRDAKPAKDFAEDAIKWMESCESFCGDLNNLSTIVYENIKEVQGAIDDSPEKQDMVLTVLQENIEVTLQMASNARDLATRAADNARFDLQTSLEEVAKVEKIIQRVELEERRARNECGAMEGRHADEDLPFDCPFATWSADMREMMQRNLRRFRKAAQYRQCCNNDGQCSGARDLLLMQVLLAKVQVIRDVKILQEAKKKSDQLTEHEKNVKASKVKVGGRKKAMTGKPTTPSPPVKSLKEAKAKLELEMEAVEEVLDNNMMEDGLSAEEEDGERDNEENEDSLLESDDDDEQCGRSILRRKRSTAASLTPKQLHGTYVPLRRQHQMRSSLIRDSLGKGRVSIGRVSKVEVIERPITPGTTMRKGICQTFTKESECGEVV